MLKDLGTLFESANIAFKAWPSCRGTHAYVEGALAIVKEHNIELADIDSIKVVVGEKSINRRLCEPLEKKQHPSVAIDAKFSIPFTVATALVHKTITLDSFTAQALKDADVLNMAEKVIYGIDANAERSDSVQGYTEIKLKNGEIKIKECRICLRSSEKPHRCRVACGEIHQLCLPFGEEDFAEITGKSGRHGDGSGKPGRH